MVAAPLSNEELLIRSDLAGQAIVRSKDTVHAYLRFTRLLKGRPHNIGRLRALLGFQVNAKVRFRYQPIEPLLGDWWDEGCFIPGNRITTHLVWDENASCYRTFWWNGTTVVSRATSNRGS